MSAEANGARARAARIRAAHDWENNELEAMHHRAIAAAAARRRTPSRARLAAFRLWLLGRWAPSGRTAP
jgi:hypothetical protein